MKQLEMILQSRRGDAEGIAGGEREEALNSSRWGGGALGPSAGNFKTWVLNFSCNL